MKKIINTSYTCDICGAVYSSAEECQKCEGSHALKADIVKMEFHRKEELPCRMYIEIGGNVYEYLLDFHCTAKRNHDIEKGINKLFKDDAND